MTTFDPEKRKAKLAEWRREQARVEFALTPEQRLREASEMLELFLSKNELPDEPWALLALRKARRR